MIHIVVKMLTINWDANFLKGFIIVVLHAMHVHWKIDSVISSRSEHHGELFLLLCTSYTHAAVQREDPNRVYGTTVILMFHTINFNDFCVRVFIVFTFLLFPIVFFNTSQSRELCSLEIIFISETTFLYVCSLIKY
jgi:hypothetical protein